MYGRYQVDNFFVTTIAEDQTLTPGVDGILEVRDIPNVESGKMFYVVFRVDNVDTRFSLPVYIDGDRLKYKGYDVKQEKTLNKNDTVSMNDLAGDFNFVFDNIDDIGYIIKKGGLDILVYGGNIIKGGVNISIADTNITLDDNATQYIVFDFNDGIFKSVTTIDNLAHYCFAEITTLGGEITNVTPTKAFSSGETFSTAFFERNSVTGAIQIKNNAIKKANIDLDTLTSDDIPEGETNKYFTNGDDYQTKANMKTNLSNPNNTTYPTTKAVKDAIEQSSGGMSAATYDPNNIAGDAFDMDNMIIGNTNIYVIKKATAPSNPVKGMVWYDTTNDVLKAYNGTNWEEIGTGGGGSGDMSKSTYDPNEVEGDVFDMDNMVNGDNNEYIIKSANAPVSPTAGMAWYDSTNNVLKTYDGTNWIVAGDVSYSDFVWQDSSNGTININNLNTKTTASSNITVNCGASVKNGVAYMLRVTATNDIEIVLGTGVYNYAGISLVVGSGETKMFVLVATSDSQLEFQGNEGGYTGNKIYTTIAEINVGGSSPSTPTVISHGLGQAPKTISFNGFIQFGDDDLGRHTASRVLATWTASSGVDFLGTIMHFSDGNIAGNASNMDTFPITVTVTSTTISLTCAYYSKMQITAYL